jgi:hypothetical protein
VLAVVRLESGRPQADEDPSAHLNSLVIKLYAKDADVSNLRYGISDGRVAKVCITPGREALGVGSAFG